MTYPTELQGHPYDPPNLQVSVCYVVHFLTDPIRQPLNPGMFNMQVGAVAGLAGVGYMIRNFKNKNEGMKLSVYVIHTRDGIKYIDMIKIRLAFITQKDAVLRHFFRFYTIFLFQFLLPNSSFFASTIQFCIGNIYPCCQGPVLFWLSRRQSPNSHFFLLQNTISKSFGNKLNEVNVISWLCLTRVFAE